MTDIPDEPTLAQIAALVAACPRVAFCDRPSRYRYQIGCRCPACRAENTEYSRIWRSNLSRRWRP